MRNFISAVPSREEARDYFINCGLSYEDITEGDIQILYAILVKELKKANKFGETSVNTIYMSKKIVLKRTYKGTLIACQLFVNSHYFDKRECITFSETGFIGLAGWADNGNVAFIIRSFIKWCDYLKDGAFPDCLLKEKK